MSDLSNFCIKTCRGVVFKGLAVLVAGGERGHVSISFVSALSFPLTVIFICFSLVLLAVQFLFSGGGRVVKRY